MNEQATSLLDRTLSRFLRTWKVSGARREVLGDVAPGLPDGDAARLRQQIDACLDGRGGEVSARARAAELGEAYCRLDAVGGVDSLGRRGWCVASAACDRVVPGRWSGASNTVG